MHRLRRLLTFAIYASVWISIVLLGGASVGTYFVAEFTIENRTSETIVVTPVGTIGPGHRAPLPTVWLRFPALPAFQSGGYRLAPGASETILYDMDDINFSEMVVEVDPERVLQLVTNPNPTAHQYRGPLARRFVLDDLTRLEPAPLAVRQAARRSDRQWFVASVLHAVLFGPWLPLAVLCRLSASRRTPATGHLH